MRKGMLVHTFFTLLLCISFYCPVLYASGDYEPFISEAKNKQLYKRPYWETLMHYKRGWGSGYRSLIDDPAFFLSPEGKGDSVAELEATIIALTEDEPTPDAHALCRFPARAAWLADELPGLADSFGIHNCQHYDEVTSRIKPHSASLIFPSGSMSAGPGSIYGHTMLRIESVDTSTLLGYAVTYAADTEGAGPVKYIVYGLGGGFEGRYAVLSYSSKLNEYSAIELRDVWEYSLNLSPEEVMRMYYHIWEMSLVTSDYYFLDENCAYNLLFFIEAGREGLKLTDSYAAVIPADTIKAIDRAGLINRVNYRPSHVKKMQTIAGTLSYDQVSLAKSVAKGKKPPASVLETAYNDAEKAAVLDLSSELVRYRYKKVSDIELPLYQKRSLDILLYRSKLRTANDYNIPRPETSPEKGHGSSRLAAGVGYAYDSPYLRLGYRHSYHSPEDNSAGYSEGVGISALDADFRYYTTSGRLAVRNFALVDLMNLSPMTHLFKPPSWVFSVGVDDRSVDAESSAYSWYVNGGIGGAFAVGNVYLWAVPFFEVQVAGRYSPNAIVGGGGRGGVIIPTGTFGKLLADGRHLWYSDESDHTESRISLEYAVYPAVNHAVAVEGQYIDRYGSSYTECALSYRLYF